MSRLWPLEVKGMQPPPSLHLGLVKAFIRGETHRTGPVLCLLRLMCGRQNQPSGPPLIHSAVRRQPPPPAPLTDREEPPQRIYLTEVPFGQGGRVLSSAAEFPDDFQGALWMLHLPQKSNIFCGNEYFLGNNSIHHLIFSAGSDT